MYIPHNHPSKGIFMKKIALALIAAAAMVFTACGPSKIEMQEMSVECDVQIEVRQVLNDSISLYVGNILYLNAKQVLGEELFPLSISTRRPDEIEKLAPTDVVNSEEEFIAYLRKAAPDMMKVGLVISETAANEIGFDESKTVEKMKAIFQKMNGGSLLLFHEKAGELTDVKKLF